MDKITTGCPCDHDPAGRVSRFPLTGEAWRILNTPNPPVNSSTPPIAAFIIDDGAGEIDQDWGEVRVPFPKDNLPDGGGGGAESVVPGHSGKDWSVEIGNRDVRMKKKLQDSNENNGYHSGGVFASGRKWAVDH